MSDTAMHPDDFIKPKAPRISPEALLRQAADTIANRAAERDTEAERSMARTVAAFNALSGHKLTERDGWRFMAVLKLGRSYSGTRANIDDYLDGAAYMALAAETLP